MPVARCWRVAAGIDRDQRGASAPFQYVSRLDLLDAGTNYRSLRARGVEWINTSPLFKRDGTLRLERGFHPNDLGYLATAESIAGSVESRLGARPTPLAEPEVSKQPTPAPTVRSRAPHVDIGEPFDSHCVIAWPTAPCAGATRST